MTVILDETLDWRQVAAVADGEALSLVPAAWARLEAGHALVSAIIASNVRAYGVNTGVGALSDTIISGEAQSRLSRKILLSHACGTGEWLDTASVRAIMAAQVNNLAHGASGIRPLVIEAFLTLLRQGVTPVVPARGSAGYLTHNAHIGLVVIGEGRAHVAGDVVCGREALSRIGLTPIVLGPKEGLSLANGTACATGLTSLALKRSERVLGWLEAAAALGMEAAGCQMPAISEEALSLRHSPGLQQSGALLRARLSGSERIAAASGRRTQDALSFRAVPHAHGAARDMFEFAALAVNRELASVSDNPAVLGTPEKPVVRSQAHAVSPGLAQAADALCLSLAQTGMMSERRLDRLVNPLLSGLPAFLATDAGEDSGFMIAQYTASALCSDNRRLSAPAATDGGVTSGLQEDFLAHATAAAVKLNAVIDNLEYIAAIELMAGAQAADILAASAKRAPGTDAIYQAVRAVIAPYADDRPLGDDFAALRTMLRRADAPMPG